MKKWQMRLTTILLVLVMSLGLATTAFAANLVVTVDGTGVTANPGDTNVRVPIRVSGNASGGANGIADAFVSFFLPDGVKIVSWDPTGGMELDPQFRQSDFPTTLTVGFHSDDEDDGYTGSLLGTLVLSVDSNATPGVKTISFDPAWSSMSTPFAKSHTPIWTAGSITVLGGTTEPDPEPQPAGYVYMVMDVNTLGAGLLWEPAKIPFYEGEAWSDCVRRFVGDANIKAWSGYTYFTDFKLPRNIDVNIPQLLLDQAAPDSGPSQAGQWLGEFDYTYMSGWMYIVDQRFPDGAAWAYPKDGDVCEWTFTYYGYGADQGIQGFAGSPYYTRIDTTALIREVAEINSAPNKAELLAKPGVQAAYNEAFSVLSTFNGDLTQERYNAAITNLQNALAGNPTDPGDPTDPAEPERVVVTGPNGVITGDADIDVTATVLEGEQTGRYFVDISWGAMQFVYSNGVQEWDPTTHTYKNTGANGTAGWLIDAEDANGDTVGYLDGDNNLVMVTNHSDGAVDASFTYAMVPGSFNANEATANAVRGGFYATNEDALKGALILADVEAGSGYSDDSYFITLPTANGKAVNDTALRGNVFFAFSGTPDNGKSETVTQTKVGVITVTFEPK